MLLKNKSNIGYNDDEIKGLNYFKHIFDIDQPKKLMFLASGTTEAPDEWLNDNDIKIIRLNGKSITRTKYEILDTFAVLCGSSMINDAYPNFNNEKYNFPYFFWFSFNKRKVNNYKNEKVILNTGHRFIFNEFNKWSSNITNRNISETVGLYIYLWLLYGKQTDIYMVGFDGWMNTPEEYYYFDGKYTVEECKRFNHDLSLEYQYIMNKYEDIKRYRNIRLHVPPLVK